MRVPYPVSEQQLKKSSRAFLGMSFTGHAALLLHHQRPEGDGKAAASMGKAPAAYWVKSSTLATLSLGVQGIEHRLTIHIRDKALVQCSRLMCTLLSPKDTGQGWVLVGAPIWPKLHEVLGHFCKVPPQPRLASSEYDDLDLDNDSQAVEG